MSIQGKTVVFTGKISMTRHEAQKLVEEYGGIAGSSVSRSTDYLVVGEAPGSKLAKAALLGIQILTEDELHDLLKEEPTTEDVSKYSAILQCKWCHNSYKQWSHLHNTLTCPKCSALAIFECPHCKSRPIYVEDFRMQHCSLCGLWFEAPVSVHTRTVKHLHLWFTLPGQTGERVKKNCPCGAHIYLTPEQAQYHKELHQKAPALVEEWRRRDKKDESERAWFNSLSDEEVEALKDQFEKV